MQSLQCAVEVCVKPPGVLISQTKHTGLHADVCRWRNKGMVVGAATSDNGALIIRLLPEMRASDMCLLVIARLAKVFAFEHDCRSDSSAFRVPRFGSA